MPRELPHDFLMAIRTQPGSPTLHPNKEDSLGGVSSITWNDVRVATNSDDSMIKLIDLIEHGFPETEDNLPTELRPYYQYKDKLTSFDGVALYNDRIIIPPGLRDVTMYLIHSMQPTKASPRCAIEVTLHSSGLV